MTTIESHDFNRVECQVEARFNVRWGRCPRCGVHDLLVEIPGLKAAFCRQCLRKANRILEEAAKNRSAEDIECIMREE